MTKIYVGNLPFSATDAEVRELFAAHGTVESVSIITDRDTGRPRGFGFVEMSRADASKAIQSLNGKDLGVLWKAPFRTDVTSALKSGANRLEVRVTNLWPNRMIGDLHLPLEQRLTWASFNPYPKGSPLFDSGLLGPVKLYAGRMVKVTQ